MMPNVTRAMDFFCRRSLSSTSASSCTPAAEVLASLSPMKRILCLCPVPLKTSKSMTMHIDTHTNSNSNGEGDKFEFEYESYSIGMAISDPYLSFAIPIHHHHNNDRELSNPLLLHIPKLNSAKSLIHTVNSSADCHIHNAKNHPIIWEGLPPNTEEFLKEIVGHHDVGALVLGLPLKIRERRMSLSTGFDCDDVKMEQVRKSMKCILHNFKRNEYSLTDSSATGSDAGQDHKVEKDVDPDNSANSPGTGLTKSRKAQLGPLDLQCFVEDHLTLAEARRFAMEEPEMWEEVDLDDLNLDESSYNGGSVKSDNSGLELGEKGQGMDGVRGSVGGDNGDNRSKNKNSSGGKEIPPTVHAATALNAFLWRHTGGWRNTFA